MTLKTRITRLAEKHGQNNSQEAKALERINKLPMLKDLFKPESQRRTPEETGQPWTKLPTLRELFSQKEPGAHESSELKTAD